MRANETAGRATTLTEQTGAGAALDPEGDVMGATVAGNLVPVLKGDPHTGRRSPGARRGVIRNGFTDASSLLVGHR